MVPKSIPLRKELSQSRYIGIGVFVGAAFPTVIGPGKITAPIQVLLPWLKAGKLFAVIKRDRLDFLRRQFPGEH